MVASLTTMSWSAAVMAAAMLLLAMEPASVHEQGHRDVGGGGDEWLVQAQSQGHVQHVGTESQHMCSRPRSNQTFH